MKVKVLFRFKPYIMSLKKEFLFSLFLLIISSTLSIATPLFIKRIIDVDIPNKNIWGVAVTAILYIFFQLVLQYLTYILMYKLECLGVKLVAELKKDTFTKLIDSDIAFFDKTTTGKAIARVESDTETIRTLFSQTLFIMLYSGFSLFGMFFVMGAINIKLFLILSVTLFPVVIGIYIFQKKIAPMFLEVRKIVSEITGFINESISAVSVIRAFSKEKYFIEKLKSLNNLKVKKEIFPDVVAMGMEVLTTFLEIGGICLVLLLGSSMIEKREISLGALVLFLTYIKQFFGPLHMIVEQIGVLQRSKAAGSRIFNILDMKSNIFSGNLSFEGFRKNIEFKNVTFSYPSRDKEENPKIVLDNISLTINKGEKVAFVGETGGGKSSIINLLYRFYEFQNGEILIDGIDIRKFSAQSLREKMSLVLQDVYLFPGSLEENITLSSEKSQRNLSSAISALFTDDLKLRFFEKFSHGTNTQIQKINERGSNLSQGERQMISFARALSFDPEILILDEATSSIDHETEKQIDFAMANLTKGRTSIIIAHRLSTIKNSDKIFVVQKGKIIESGNHLELLHRNGIYAALCRTQYKELA